MLINEMLNVEPKALARIESCILFMAQRSEAKKDTAESRK